MEVKQGRKAVKGVRVRIKGPGIDMITNRSNASGTITTKIKPKKSGIVSFRPMVAFACTALRGVVAPPPQITG